MEFHVLYFIGVLTMFNLVHHVTSLQCYACADTGLDNDCTHYDTYADGIKGKRPGVVRNCTSPYDEHCFIEIYSGGGVEVSHIRDCSNGTFSFSLLNGTIPYSRFENMTCENETACIYNGLHQICLSKCDTDLCNGPLVTDINSANTLYGTVLALALLGVLIVGLFRD